MNTPLPLGLVSVPSTILDAVADAAYHEPHSVLGMHINEHGATIRTRKPLAHSVKAVFADGTELQLAHEHNGIWAAYQAGRSSVCDYQIVVNWDGSGEHSVEEPYRFLPTIGELDLHLIGEGRHEELWHVMGAHIRNIEGVAGTSFTVWAPNAQAVRVTGSFNDWDGRHHAMRSLGATGIWELFIPGVEAGSAYKFQIRGKDGSWHEKADPLARATECPPATASVVTKSTYTWQDEAYLAKRAERQAQHAPMSVYEVHLGSWRTGLSYVELAEHLVNYVVDLNFTHVEFLPVAEHPYGPSWGYQVTSYFAPTARFGSPDEFRYLVDALHQAGIGVILDWVPAHFPKDAFALGRFDGEPLYEHADPRLGEHPDWGTYIFNFGRTEVRNFLVANALYWLEEFHIDGLRVDAVASMLYRDYSRAHDQWIPNHDGGRENYEAIEFLQEANATAYKRVPGIMMIAEESTSFPGVTKATSEGGLGFGFKWNMGWMHDTLEYYQHEPIHRQYHHNDLTFAMVYAYSENFILPISHDEVVHGKGSLIEKAKGDDWQKLAQVRAYLAFMWAHPGKQLIFMGCEFAQYAEWSEGRELDWWLLDQPKHQGIHSLVKQLNTTMLSTPALYELDHEPRGFQWLNGDDAAHNCIAFARFDQDGEPLVAVINFANSVHHDYQLPMPCGGVWEEVVNTDAEVYGGSNVGNGGSITAQEAPLFGRSHSASITVPPLAALMFKPRKDAS